MKFTDGQITIDIREPDGYDYLSITRNGAYNIEKIEFRDDGESGVLMGEYTFNYDVNGNFESMVKTDV